MSDPGERRIELQILGPVRLLSDGRTLPLKIRKGFALLLLLAIEGSLSRPRLCAWLWPALDESSARRNLRRELVRLREAGAGAAVRADGDHLHPGIDLGCDLLRAEALLAAGQPETALALWRGDTAEGLDAGEADDHEADGDTGFAPWLTALRHRAAALRQQAFQASAAAAEARGDLAGASRQVEALLKSDNLLEGAHRDAMRLLAAMGQREAALRQFERCKALLQTELGLQPMPETQALAAALRGAALPPAGLGAVATPDAPDAPSVHAPAATPDRHRAVELPPQLPFVGREAEVDRLQRAWARRQTVILVGEAGVGKTRLATDFAASQGPYASVRCQVGDAELPLSSFTRALRVLAGQPPDLAGLEPWVVAELARLLPELGPSPPALRNADDRLRFDEACLRGWLALAGEAFDSVVLDDWQWADSASRALLARAAGRRREQGRGALEILGWRGEPGEAELLACAEALAAEPMPLRALPDTAVQELVRQLSGSAEPVRFAQRLRNATGGHPFFIAETLRDLAERALLLSDREGRWLTPFDELTADYRELPLPASVRDAVLARVHRLGAATTRLLEAAALAGEPLSAAWLARACALSELEALAALDEAARVRLVVAREGGGYAWAHDLARLALESALEPTRRRLIHHRLALAAESQGARAEAARHFEACGEPARAVPHRLAAGDAAQALHALAEAAAQWRQGLADGPAPADEAALLARLCDIEWLQGHAEEALAVHRRLLPRLADAAVAAADLADPLLRAAHYLTSSGDAAASLALLDTMPAPAAAALRQREAVLRMGALHQLGRLDEAHAAGQQALAWAAPDSRERAEVLATLSTLSHSRGRTREAVAQADAGLSIYTRLGDTIGRARTLFYRGAFSVELGDNTRAEADMRASATLAGQHGNTYLQRMVLYNLASIYSNQSRPGQALAVANEAWPTLAGTPREEIALMFRSMFIECHFQRGEWGAMWEHLEPAAGDVLARAQLLTMLGVANCALEPAAMLGRWDCVAPLVQALEDAKALDDVPVAAEVSLGCAYAALVRGEPDAAAGWLQRVQAAGEAEHPRVRCRALLLRAELAVLGGAGVQALAGIPTDDAAGMNPELRLRALTTRWRAGGLPREDALAALDDPGAHAGAALLLAHALGGEAYRTRRQRLAESLVALPNVQMRFLAAWR